MKRKTSQELLFEQLFKHYDGVTVFMDGIAKAFLNGKCGFIDTYFNEITPIKYDWITNFTRNYANVILNKKEGLVRIDGKEITLIEFDEMTNMLSRGCAYGIIGDKVYKVDKDGNKQLVKENCTRLDLFDIAYPETQVVGSEVPA